MSIFRKKKQETEVKSCCCGENCDSNTTKETSEKKNQLGIKILGAGCAKCSALEAATLDALKELGSEDKIEHVTDFTEIAAYGVMSTPALVVDGKVVSYGKVLKTAEIVEILTNAKK